MRLDSSLRPAVLSLASVSLALVILIGLLREHRDYSVSLKSDDLLGLELVEHVGSLLEVGSLGGGLGELGLQLLDLVEALLEGGILVSVDTLLLGVGGLGEPSLGTGLEELGRGSL